MTTRPLDLFLSGSRPVPTRGVLSLLGRLLRWLDAWEDRRHLHALSDHMLRDMDFTRDQIDGVLRGAVRRP